MTRAMRRRMGMMAMRRMSTVTRSKHVSKRCSRSRHTMMTRRQALWRVVEARENPTEAFPRELGPTTTTAKSGFLLYSRQHIK